MPVICWGPLAKSAQDPTTIPDYIAAKILDHDVSPSAHGLDGYAVYNHRVADIIDHVDYSVISDKISSDWIIGKKFETSPGVGPGTDGVIFDTQGIMMYQSAVRKVNIPKTGNPEFQGDISANILLYLKEVIQTSFESLDGWYEVTTGSIGLGLGHVNLLTNAVLNGYALIHADVIYDGDGINFWKNPYFQTMVRLMENTEQFAYFIMGGDMDGFGFKIVNGDLFTRHYSGGDEYATDISSGIDITAWHEYRVVLKIGVSLKFYVDGVLKNTVTANLPTGNEDEYLEWFRYYIKTNAAAAKRMIIKNLLMVQDR